ncbi:unnamed protein product [Brassica oleracea var. botrytis]
MESRASLALQTYRPWRAMTAIFVVLWVVLSSSLVATGYFLHEFNRPRPSLLHPPRFKLLLSPVHHQRLAVVANGDRDLGIAEKA